MRYDDSHYHQREIEQLYPHLRAVVHDDRPRAQRTVVVGSAVLLAGAHRRPVLRVVRS